jgi:hypothetical protein
MVNQDYKGRKGTTKRKSQLEALDRGGVARTSYPPCLEKKKPRFRDPTETLSVSFTFSPAPRTGPD